MELEAQLADLKTAVRTHGDNLLTEEAAKTALVMPFIRALGYNVFDPTEVVPEYIADVGTKKGEKVDYAITTNGKLSLLIECKPSIAELTNNHASQLFRYFTATEARVGILTNGVIFQFFSDTDTPNKMDDKPFFTLDMRHLKKADLATLSKFTKDNFNIETIVVEAGNLKMQSLVSKELDKEFVEPSDAFIKLIAGRVYGGRVTAAIRDTYESLIINSVETLIRERVNERLKSAIESTNSSDADDNSTKSVAEDSQIQTTQVEIDGFNIIRAIGSRLVAPDRIIIRDAKSYCAVLLDDNNRRTIARMHFNSERARYLGTFVGKEETRHAVDGPIDLYKFEAEILDRIKELDEQEATAAS